MKLLSKITIILLLVVSNSFAKETKTVEQSIQFKSNDIELAGTLFTPKSNNDKYVTIVFVHGSAPTTRTDRYYNYLKDDFIKKGYAVFLYDKRGNGESGGSKEGPTDFNLLSDDVVAAVNTLKFLPNVNAEKIGIIGTSQGGWVGPLAASKSADISFVVTISGPGTSVMEQNLYQHAQEMEDYNVPLEDIADITNYKMALLKYFGTGEGYEEVKQLNEAVKNKSWFGNLESHEQTIYPPKVINTHPAFQSFKLDMYDPKPVIEKIRVPFLAVFGEKDRHIPVVRSMSRIKEITHAAGNAEYFEIKSFPNKGHLLQIVDSKKELLTGSKETTQEQRIDYMTKFKSSPEFIIYLIDWINEITK